MPARTLTSLVVVVALAGLVGCMPDSGTIIGVSGPQIGPVVPDIQYRSAEGTKGNFNSIRHSLALVVFSPPEGARYCSLDPKVVNLSDHLWNLPVTVAQISLPNGKCPHGQGCLEAGNLRNRGLVTLYDANCVAWNAYGQPTPGSVIMIGPGNKVLMTGSLDHPRDILSEARRLGQEEQERARGDRL
jgi:hypothetical protein